MDKEPFFRSAAFRIALWGGLSTGPVLALAWPVFVRLESGVWPASPLALTLAMLTLGTLTGLAAAFTVLLPVLGFLELRPGPRLPWKAAAAGAGVALLLVAAFGLFAGVGRMGAQWSLWCLLAAVGALCGWIGGQVHRRRSAPDVR